MITSRVLTVERVPRVPAMARDAYVRYILNSSSIYVATATAYACGAAVVIYSLT